MYYPLSEITSNLYTNGSDFVYKGTNQSYKGYYYATTDGKYYTGSNFTPTAQEIIKLDTKNLSNNSISPSNYIPIPTESDYEKGYITRYAIKRVNSGFDTIKEVSKLDYEKSLKDPLYASVSFNWKLTGPLYDDISNVNNPIGGIIDTNQKTIVNLEKTIAQLSDFFKNFAQYAKIY